MSMRDAKELCLILALSWVVVSGIWSCGSQLVSAGSFIYQHVRIIK